jgi:glycyl-tRNA synthetase
MFTFQNIILNLQNFWTRKGCVLQQSHDLQTGAGTFNPETFLRALGDLPYNVCHVEICKRPTDGRYGENPNRLQRFHQFQVMMKPTPKDMQKLFLESLEAIGFDLKKHDIRFVHDDWESPTQGASGVGWEVWCDGMEITQFTYFQQIGGVLLSQIPAEIAYGVERIALFLQNKSNVYELDYNETLSYADVFLQGEKEYSEYNFEQASIEMWKKRFDESEKECKKLLELKLSIPAYDMAIEASHSFNMLDARGAISTTARVSMIHRVKDLCCLSAKIYSESIAKNDCKVLEQEQQKKYIPPKEFFAKSADFLLEVGCEHLPANAIDGAISSLEILFQEFLSSHNIGFKKLEVFATARRLAVLVHSMNSYTEENVEEKKGPLISAAFDDLGNVTKGGEGFFKSIGLNILSKKDFDQNKKLSVKEDKIFYSFKKEKIFTGKLLQENLKNIILQIRFPKKMRWGKEGVLFSRPISSLVALFKNQVIDFSIEGVISSNQIALNQQIEGKSVCIKKPSEYLSKLRNGKVIVSVEERKEFINNQLDKICLEHGVEIVSREVVLSQVLYLSEYPLLKVGTFDPSFLSLPSELIIKEMIDHQKYFPIMLSDGQLVNKFVVALDNLPSELMIKNNQGVLKARLSDGLFLYQKDLKSSFEEWNNKLKEVVLHPKLGSIYNKVGRIVLLSEKIAQILGFDIEIKGALYCKADLVSEVVYEFSELQGIMGSYYAKSFGQSEQVAKAIEESYMPLSEGAKLPSTKTGIVVALADRIDSLVSYIAIGLIPSSSKDPYALRRAAVGILRILIESKISFDLRSVISEEKVLEFIIARMKGLLKEYGFAAIDIDLCGVYDSFDPYNIYKCVEAIANFKNAPDNFTRLIEVYKRVKGSCGEDKSFKFLEENLREAGEKNLYKALKNLEKKYITLLEEKNYKDAFSLLTNLIDPLEVFFDTVRVQDKDEVLRKNRMALLQIPYNWISLTWNF